MKKKPVCTCFFTMILVVVLLLFAVPASAELLFVVQPAEDMQAGDGTVVEQEDGVRIVYEGEYVVRIEIDLGDGTFLVIGMPETLSDDALLTGGSDAVFVAAHAMIQHFLQNPPEVLQYIADAVLASDETLMETMEAVDTSAYTPEMQAATEDAYLNENYAVYARRG